jgi:hypothetical protein
MTKSNEKPLHICACPDCRRHPHSPIAKLHLGINRVATTMDEKSRRRFVGLLATQQGWGGVQQMSQITGLSRTTILRGQREIERTDPPRSRRKRIRRRGGGRPRVEKNNRTSGKP